MEKCDSHSQLPELSMSFDGTAFVAIQTTIRSRTLAGNLGSNHDVICQAKRTVATRTAA